jgi:hypothetical protein
MVSRGTLIVGNEGILKATIGFLGQATVIFIISGFRCAGSVELAHGHSLRISRCTSRRNPLLRSICRSLSGYNRLAAAFAFDTNETTVDGASAELTWEDSLTRPESTSRSYNIAIGEFTDVFVLL